MVGLFVVPFVWLCLDLLVIVVVVVVVVVVIVVVILVVILVLVLVLVFSSCLRGWFVCRSLCLALPRRRAHRVTIILTNDLGHESKSQFNPAFCSHRGLFCLHNPRD